MGRGLLILSVFAVVVAAVVYLGPLDRLVARRGLTQSPASRVAQPADASAPTQADTDPSASAPPPRAERDPVLVSTAPVVTTPAQPTSAMAALPAKPIPGFPPVPQGDLSDEQMGAAVKQARLLASQAKPIEARDLLSDVYLGHRLTTEQRLRLAEQLEPLSEQILESRTALDGGHCYDVQPGDALVKLARPFHVPHEFVMRLNKIADPRSIRPRQTLKLVEGPFDVLVELTAFELTVLRKGKFVRRFPVAIGRDESPTPAELFTVNMKQVNPKKWPDAYDRRMIEGGDPTNPLGSRWIGFGLGYGIHGTIEPESIGQKASRGCVRMHNEDVEQLYDMVLEGSSRVLIRQ